MDPERSEWRRQRRQSNGHARSRLATVRGCGVLPAVKRIAELHRAVVTLESGAGGAGLRVVVRFPQRIDG